MIAFNHNGPTTLPFGATSGYIVVWTNVEQGTGNTWPNYPRHWETGSPAMSGGLIRAERRANRLVERMLTRKWPCAVAAKPGPPPVLLCDSSEDPVVPREHLPSGRRSRPRVRLHGRQSVPSRTRRKLRVWERTAQPSSNEQEKTK